MTAPQSTPTTNTPTTTVELEAVSLLDAVLAATETKKTEPMFEVWPDQLLAQLSTVPTPTKKEVKKATPRKRQPKRATEEQKALIGRLRETGRNLPGTAAEVVAKSKCDDSEAAAASYITELQELIAEASKYTAPVPAAKPAPTPAPAVKTPYTAPKPTTLYGRTKARAGLPATSSQWAYIKHLRGRMRDINTAQTRSLAAMQITNDRKQAALLIQRMIDAARAQFQAGPKPKLGTMICSSCWELGCNIGPMVPYTGQN